MLENKKTIMLQKVGTIALLCLLVIAFVGSIFCAMILPFVNLSPDVADAYSANFEGVLEQSFSGYTLRNIPSPVTQLCALFFKKGYVPDFASWDVPVDTEIHLVRANFSETEYLNMGLMRMSPSMFSDNFGVTPSGEVYYFAISGEVDNYWMSFYCTEADATLINNAIGPSVCNLSIPFSWQSAYGFRIANFTSFTVNTAYIDKLETWVSLSSTFATVSVGPTQEEYDTVVNERDEWKQMYDKLVNDMGFSTFNSVDLVSTKPDSISVGGVPILSSRATTATYNNVNYGGYWYYRSNVENAGSNRAYLCEFDIGSTLVANSDIKLTYNAIFPYNLVVPDNVVVVLGLSNYGASSNASNYKEHIVIIKKEDFINGSIVVNVPFDVNYIAFELCTYDSSTGALDKLELGMPNVTEGKFQGIFISNFVVSGRGANFNTVIDNANKQGYNKGYQDGKTAGYDIGFQAGVNDNGDYTFMGLLGSVFDAPISAFRGLFDFEILGTNMQGFVLALLTLSVIVVIIKIALGGR